MRALTPFALVNLCEQGRSLASLDRALLMAAAAAPELDFNSLLHLSIGRRDALLLRARELTFGPHIEGVTDCPSCAYRVEMEFGIDDIRAEAEACEPGRQVEIDGFEIDWRAPDTEDLRAASLAIGTEAARLVLLSRCVVARKEGVEVSPGSIPDGVISAVVLELARSDPQADVRLNVVCPACRHSWTALFDIVTFLWQEMQRAAQKLLHDVHTLASAYGWSESEILSLSTWRRQAYLGMAAG
jgi:hypothetical protein